MGKVLKQQLVMKRRRNIGRGDVNAPGLVSTSVGSVESNMSWKQKQNNLLYRHEAWTVLLSRGPLHDRPVLLRYLPATSTLLTRQLPSYLLWFPFKKPPLSEATPTGYLFWLLFLRISGRIRLKTCDREIKTPRNEDSR